MKLFQIRDLGPRSFWVNIFFFFYLFRGANLFEQFLVEGIKGYDRNTFEFGPEIQKMSFKDFLILALGATSFSGVELCAIIREHLYEII